MGRLTAVLRDTRALFAAGSVAGMTDRELLDRFVARSAELSEPAFSALVARHGRMVYGVCRRILSDPHDVDDAFQAIFLVLVRRAGSIRVHDSLGPWLYGVSQRVATRARVASSRRRARDAPDFETMPAPADHSADARDVRSAIDAELARLPERYRRPVVLCYLEGLTHEEASRKLRCPVGTIKSRLARGREQLRGGLTRRGLAPPAGAGIAILLFAESPDAAVPLCLSRATVRAAMRSHAMGRWVTAGACPASVSALTEGALRAMVWTNVKPMAAFVVLCAAVGAGSFALRTSRADDPRPEAAAQAEPATPPAESPADRAIAEKLKQPISLNLDQVALSEAVALVANYTGLNLVLDPSALAENGLTTATEVSLVVTDVSLKTTLKLMLKPLGLGYEVDGHVVLITTLRELRTVTRTYDVADLAGETDGKMDYAPLIDLLTSSVAPGTWRVGEVARPAREPGKPLGSVTPFFLSRSLIVDHTAAVHEKLTVWLAKLRRLNRSRAAEGQKPPLPIKTG